MIDRQNKLQVQLEVQLEVQKLTVSSLLQRWCLRHRSHTNTDSVRMCCTTTHALQIDACALSPKAHMVPLSARMDPTIVELPVTNTAQLSDSRGASWALHSTKTPHAVPHPQCSVTHQIQTPQTDWSQHPDILPQDPRMHPQPCNPTGQELNKPGALRQPHMPCSQK